ncbi:N-acetylmuramoyl-L-alanine amidase family protein [Salinimicrobium xinjiangense]|uniref:N-acetylmuramoyl-L-alanine amidase family protein n=1 Tax=Salinimicrobium xinjiangense TaxID=438596 RepID=UPI00040325AC|nr:N-acetylmuramoyl-L-alanine amidase [Salinimicrobium xinjiangense]
MKTKLLALIIFFTCFNFVHSTTILTDPPREKFVVVLDAGHGGQDPGNRGNGYYEKDIALNIVLSIGAELEKLPDVKVIYTRKSDVFVTLAGRAEIANKAEADLFISVHCNAHKSQAQGTETFVLGLHRNQDNLEVAMRENQVIFLEEDYEVTYDGFNPNSPESYIGLTLMQEEFLDQSVLLADLIQKNFTHDLKRVNRGVKQAGFLVLRQTYMPSVLVETGFLTNTGEGSYLNSRSGQSGMPQAITKAVLDYKKSINLEILEGLDRNPPVALTAEPQEQPLDIYDGITFRVQLAATGKKIEPNPKNFRGLREVSRNKEGKLFKYYYGATSSYSQIKELHEIARRSGYPDSYIVAFRGNEKISVNDALKTKMK